MGLSGERRRHEVRVRRGDDLLREEGVAQIDLLKVDVEGAELDVLEGLHDTLKRSRDAAILIELNPASVTAAGCDPVGVWSSLRQLGFDVHDVNDRALDSPQFDAWPPLASHGYRNLIAVRRRPRSED